MTSLMAKSAGHCRRSHWRLDHFLQGRKNRCGDRPRSAAPSSAISTLIRKSKLSRIGGPCVRHSSTPCAKRFHRPKMEQPLQFVRAQTWDRVALLVLIDRTTPRTPEEHRSLSICLARTLLELDGCRTLRRRCRKRTLVRTAVVGWRDPTEFATSHAH